MSSSLSTTASFANNETIKYNNESSMNLVTNNNNKDDDDTTKRPIVTVQIRPTGPNCPIGFPTTTITTSSTINNNHGNNSTRMISFQVITGGCVWIQGSSGRGKTTIVKSIVPELYTQQQQYINQHILHLNISCIWHINNTTTTTSTTIPYNNDQPLSSSSCCGVLFQQTTLIDELTVAGNLALAIRQHRRHNNNNSNSNNNNESYEQCIKRVMELVGLHYDRDCNKRCTALSGGMARRVCIAIQLLQQKQIIVLDEPFTGLDDITAISIAKELYHLRLPPNNIAFILITHQPELAKIVMGDINNNSSIVGNVIVPLPAPETNIHTSMLDDDHNNNNNTTLLSKNKVQPPKLNMGGIYFYNRFVEKLYDYVLYSVPLIGLTFIATGIAIAMLSADSLQRLNINEPILQLIDTEVRPLLTMLTGSDEVNPFHMMGIKFKVRQMLQTTIPIGKMKIYCIGITQLFILEIGPLLTGLLLAGRIGGSYSGTIATMISTSQTNLLITMGISSTTWNLYPSLLAAWIAGPILTILGTCIALLCTSTIGVQYNIVPSINEFWIQVQNSTFPQIRIKGLVQEIGNNSTATLELPSSLVSKQLLHIGQLDYYRTTYSPHIHDSIIEIVTYPIIYALLKSFVYISIIICTAELCARYYNTFRFNIFTSLLKSTNNNHIPDHHHHTLTHRDVPHVITTSVVTASLCIIITDWAFSQLWLQRK